MNEITKQIVSAILTDRKAWDKTFTKPNISYIQQQYYEIHGMFWIENVYLPHWSRLEARFGRPLTDEETICFQEDLQYHFFENFWFPRNPDWDTEDIIEEEVLSLEIKPNLVPN